MDESVRLALHQRKQPQDLLVALLHAALRGGGAVVGEWRGIDCLYHEATGRQQGVCDGELIIDLVERVGIDDDPEPSLRQLQAPDERLVTDDRKRHGLSPSTIFFRWVATAFDGVNLSCRRDSG